MSANPQQIADDTQAVIDGWSELASTATFAKLTLAQYQAAVQPSFDARAKINSLETELKAQKDARDQADLVTNKTTAAVIKAVVADPNFGDDSALYEAMGYVRKSARASGLTRKTKPAPATK